MSDPEEPCAPYLQTLEANEVPTLKRVISEEISDATSQPW